MYQRSESSILKYVIDNYYCKIGQIMIHLVIGYHINLIGHNNTYLYKLNIEKMSIIKVQCKTVKNDECPYFQIYKCTHSLD